MRCQHASGMLAWHAESVTEGESRVGRGKRKKRSVRRRVSGGNVVPAVGMCEGATPRRMEYLAITRFKNFYLISTNNCHIFYARFRHKFLSDGALPLLTSPHGGEIPPCPIYLTAPSSLEEAAALHSWQSAHSVTRAYTVLLKPISGKPRHI